MSRDRVGQVIGGCYELRAVTEHSTQFTTYEGFHLDRELGVTVELVDTCNLGHERLQRFRTEARVISRMRHPNILELLDFGQLEDDSPFIVHPAVTDVGLDKLLDRGPWGPELTIEVLLQVARGVRFAHQFGVFHLALTPSNVLMSDHAARVAGFMASRWHRIDERTPPIREFRTAAPEVLRGADPGPAADVYAFGHLAYACLTGELAVGTSVEAGARAAHLAPRPWTFDENFDATSDLGEIVSRCMSKELDTRPRDFDQVVGELERSYASVASTQRLNAVQPAAYFPSVGDVFAQKYVIEAVIGQGGFARVFRARSVASHQRVALKILRPDRTRDTAEARRFVREGKLIFSLLTNPHTISVYGYGEAENGLLYIAFEFIDGESLESLLDGGSAFRADRVVRLLEQCLVSLAEAHGMGVLHRDIKPSNIMLSRREGIDDWVTVLDFGVAKITSDIIDRNELTVAGKAVGTPRYMSPEQISGESLGPESDLYSLGLVAYELLSGEPAVCGDNVLELLTAQLDPQSAILPTTSNVPIPLALIVNRMMRKDRKSRYQLASDVLADLQQLGRAVGDQTLDTSSR